MKKRLTLAQKDSLTGLAFIFPWLIGIVAFIAFPLLQSLLYSFCEVKLKGGGFDVTFKGVSNYLYVINEHARFRPDYITSLLNIIYQVPAIILFSLFMSVIVNNRFIGRTFVRAVLFLPVIITSGVIMQIFREDVMAEALVSTENTIFLNSVSIVSILEKI